MTGVIVIAIRRDEFIRGTAKRLDAAFTSDALEEIVQEIDPETLEALLAATDTEFARRDDERAEAEKGGN
jgi:hypothetical protein